MQNTSTPKDASASLAVVAGSAPLQQLDALIAELLDHHKYPSGDAYAMATKLRRIMLGQPDAPSPNVAGQPRPAERT